MQRETILKSLYEQLSLDSSSNVCIIGLGLTGYSVARFLSDYDIALTVIDNRLKPPFYQQLLAIDPLAYILQTDFNSINFEGVSHLVVSPSISVYEPFIQQALSIGIHLISDIDLFACATQKPIVAITGSNGKSTVTTLLGAMGHASGVYTAIGGNLGVPALDLLHDSIALYVIELSSFQLERVSVLNATVATVLNISADHLDRHAGIDGYAQEKQVIFAGNGMMVLNADDVMVMAMYQQDREIRYFSMQQKTDFYRGHYQGDYYLMHGETPVIRESELGLEGSHNIANALAALALGAAVNLPVLCMCEALHQFSGLDHRMQKVATIQGITWVNDSKATNVGACVAALQGYIKKVILIAGGDAKNADLTELVPVIKAKTRAVILLGQDADKIESAINKTVRCHHAKSMREAVNMAANLAKKDETVLLSPACASIDQYKNYQQRGEQFATAVLALEI